MTNSHITEVEPREMQMKELAVVEIVLTSCVLLNSIKDVVDILFVQPWFEQFFSVIKFNASSPC